MGSGEFDGEMVFFGPLSLLPANLILTENAGALSNGSIKLRVR